MLFRSIKALSLDTDIPTPSGWQKMRDLHPGDFVFSVDGKPTEILFESETFDKPMYRVTFEDGTEIDASADHIWTVQTKDSRRLSRRPVRRTRVKPEVAARDGWYEITTEQMLSDFYRDRRDGKGREYKYRVPQALPVQYPRQDLPVDPYVLGVWLGDGSSKGDRKSVV